LDWWLFLFGTAIGKDFRNKVMEHLIVFEKSRFWIEDGILFWKMANDDIDYKLDGDMIKQYIQAIHTLCDEKPKPFLIDIRDVKGTYTINAAKLLANSKHIKKVRLAEAYVINSLGVKLLISSYKRIYEPSTEYEIFYVLDDAVKYCKAKKEIKNPIL
jgi:hypothetical protein